MTTDHRNAAGDPPASRLEAMKRGVERMIPVPAGHRDARLDVDEAAHQLGCDSELVELLVAAGFPAEETPRGPRFDYHDVMNLGLQSGTGKSVAELGERSCMRLATGRPESWTTARTWRVRLAASVEGSPETVVVPLPPAPKVLGGELLAWQADVDGPGTAEARLTTRGLVDSPRTDAVRDIHDQLLDELATGVYQYGWIPGTLRAEPRTALAHRMADCVVSAWLMRERAEEAGLRARTRKGFLLGLIGVEHAWTEVYEEGRWLVLDPVLAYLGGRQRNTAPEFADFCRGSIHNRVLAWDRTAEEPLADHVSANGERILVDCRPLPLAD
ncbi:transglutaminase domain-containing protein [Streptomyces sp. AC563]|uniref:transglutaminase domain-containing protein n=1 Tax=Streptomyces buecherae TaxID=2763006 RepID=UPI00164E5768|nr:transglutaminase domain-containing protein [Streptomyces buecherae]MBC3988216.1 transglutaminase domain-containing protein [Streptomyces buecherae]